MKRSSRFSKALLATCAFTAAMACGSAFGQCAPASPSCFTVNEGVIPGALPFLINADRITFGYSAMVNQTIGGGSLAGSDDPFTEVGFLNKASYELGSGNAVSSQLNSITPNGYKIYGVFTITGEADPSGTGGILATFATATLTLYLDPNSDTTLGFNGAGTAVTVGGGTADDVAIANLNLITGQAHVFPCALSANGCLGTANGDFDALENLGLTAFGQTLFISPSPFFNAEDFSGNTSTITGPVSATQSFQALFQGAGVELFLRVPEPGTLSIAGLALLGMGALSRRQRKKT